MQSGLFRVQSNVQAVKRPLYFGIIPEIKVKKIVKNSENTKGSLDFILTYVKIALLTFIDFFGKELLWNLSGENSMKRSNF